MICLISKMEKQVDTHTEWEKWENLSLVGSKFDYFHRYYYRVSIVLHLCYNFIQLAPLICGYDELNFS